MRRSDERSGREFSYVDLEARVRAEHCLRAIREIVNEALGGLSPVFARFNAPLGRPLIPPEQLLRALWLQAFYPIRSERQLMERPEFDLLLRWLVGLGIEDPVWDHSTFSKAATGCSRVTAPPSSRPRCSTGPRCAGCCRASTSR